MRTSFRVGAVSGLALFVALGACSDDAPVEPLVRLDASSSSGRVNEGGDAPHTDMLPSDAASESSADAVDADASGRDGAAAPCTRAAEATTAPASIYDVFVADMAALTGPARTARVDAFVGEIASRGGTPLEDPRTGRAVFVVRGAPPSTSWAVFGSFVAGDRARALGMTQVAGTDLWVLDTTAIPSSTAHTYRLLSGTDASGDAEDTLARNIQWDGVVRGTPTDLNSGRFDGIVHPYAIASTKGRLVRHGRVNASVLGNQRAVYVYLPATYDDGSCSDFPTIAFSDGNESLTRGDYAGAADALYAATPALSAVLVFASLASTDLQQRTDEYSFGFGGSKGTQYVDFLASDLGPAIESRYRVCNRPEARGVAGVSLGGLIASFAAFERPAAWGWVGSQSGSYWWNGSQLVTRATNTTPRVPARFYLDSSCPNDNCADVDAFAAALATKSYDYQRIKTNVPVQPPDPHDWSFFKLRAAELLTHFRSGQTACN